jgi:hypothetical protein
MSQGNVTVPFKKLINVLAVDCHGRQCLLVGPKAMYTVDLEQPQRVSSKTVQRDSKRAVVAVEFNPHQARATIAVTAANTEVFLWQVSDGAQLLTSIEAHRRAVADLNWSPFDANLLATCAADTFVHLWDVRDPRNSLKLKSFSGYTAAATQVKFSRGNRMQLASSHGGEIRIWDVRVEQTPLSRVAAHTSPITALDWSYVASAELLSCSHDRTVKFWNVDAPTPDARAHDTLPAGVPVQRAMFVPQARACVTAAARDDYALRVYATSPVSSSALHAFVGHTDVVGALAWRRQQTAPLQLVSWGVDQTLRLWNIDERLLPLPVEPHDVLNSASMFATPPASGGDKEALERRESGKPALATMGSAPTSVPGAAALTGECRATRARGMMRSAQWAVTRVMPPRQRHVSQVHAPLIRDECALTRVECRRHVWAAWRLVRVRQLQRTAERALPLAHRLHDQPCRARTHSRCQSCVRGDRVVRCIGASAADVVERCWRRG